MAESDSQYLLVAAFDFGTTYSGYAFSFRDNPLKVQTNQNWIAGSEKLISLKTPTCVLLSPDGEFHSFGFEAENKYTSLAEDEEHQGWLFFRRFKMLLHNNEALSRATKVEDINGKKMPALTIFSMSIRYLKDHLLNQLNKQTTGIEETDIRYVMTVPAIWNDNAKQFMREAAIKAGVNTKRLKLAREPEAASIWCEIVTNEAKGALSGSGTKYMVIDLGGGTADISVHEKNEDGTLKELHKASGGPWGGMYVDNNYLQFLEKLFGKTTIEKFKNEAMVDYFDLLRDFETKKRNVGFDKYEQMTFRICPYLKDLSEEEEDRSLEERLAALNLENKILIKRDKMRVDASVVKTWFDCPVDSVIEHVKAILNESQMKKLNSILLVGGFGESQYVQNKIKTSFPTHRLLVPDEASLAVLKGAVRYGHEPSLVSARVMTFTYGIGVSRDFDASVDMRSEMCFINGKQKVRNVFSAFVRAGDTVPVGYEKKRSYNPLDMDATVVPIYCTSDPNPQYTTDKGSHLLGQLVVEHPEGETLEDKSCETMLIFGETELIVKARIKKTGKEFFTTIDCLK